MSTRNKIINYTQVVVTGAVAGIAVAGAGFAVATGISMAAGVAVGGAVAITGGIIAAGLTGAGVYFAYSFVEVLGSFASAFFGGKRTNNTPTFLASAILSGSALLYGLTGDTPAKAPSVPPTQATLTQTFKDTSCKDGSAQLVSTKDGPVLVCNGKIIATSPKPN